MNEFYGESDLYGMIARKFSAPTYTTLFQVRDGTGYQTAGQSADAMAFGVWPSRGLDIIGFEIKSYRSDWLRELKNPAKAETIASFCDLWYLVTGSDNVAKMEELPRTWGWFVGSEKGLKMMKEPERLTPKPLSRIFLMSIMRNVAKSYVPMTQVDTVAESKAKEISARKSDEMKYKLQRASEIEKTIKTFKEVSGIDLEESWDFPVKEVGSIVKAVLDNDFLRQAESVKKAAAIVGETISLINALPIIQIRRES